MSTKSEDDKLIYQGGYALLAIFAVIGVIAFCVYDPFNWFA